MQFVILIAVSIMLVWAVGNPFVGLIGLLTVNILRPGELYPVFASLHMERVLAIVVLVSLLVHERRIATPKITKTVLIFWGTMFLAIPFAIWRSNAFDTTLTFGQTITYHLMIVTLLKTEQRFKIFLITFMVLIGWLAGSSLISYLQGNVIVAMGIERASGLTSAGGDPNTLGLTLVSGLPLIVLVLNKQMPKWARFMAIGVTGLAVATVISTGSRMSFFTLILAIGLFAATSKHRFVLVPAALIILAVGWMFIPQQYKDRYETVNSLQKDESYQNRLLAWQAGWGMFKSNPLTGIGPGNFAVAAGSEFWPGEGRKHWLNAHSLPLKVIGELGIFGTLAFFFMLVTLFRLNGQLKRMAKDEPDLPGYLAGFPVACNFSLIILLIAGYTSHNLYRSTWYMLASLSGALYLMMQAKREPSAEVQSQELQTTNTPAMDATV